MYKFMCDLSIIQGCVLVQPFSKRLCIYIIMRFNSDLLILIVGLMLFSIFYVIASFGYKLFPKNAYPFKYIFAGSLLAAILAYCIKIPLFYYYGKDDVINIYILYISIISVAVSLYSKFILHNKIPTHTYIILSVIVLLIGLNEYLNSIEITHM